MSRRLVAFRLSRCVLVIVFSFLVCGQISGQSHGKAIFGLTIDSRGNAVPGVLVKIINQGQDYSKEKTGEFRIAVSQDVHGGSKVMFYIQKPGWHLIDQRALWTILPEDFDGTPVSIKLAPDGKVKADPLAILPVQSDTQWVDSNCRWGLERSKQYLDLLIALDFRSVPFNVPSYLESIRVAVRGFSGNNEHISSNIEGAVRQYHMCISNPTGTSFPSTLTLEVGSKSYSLSTVGLHWKTQKIEEGYSPQDSRVSFSSATATISLEDPDWPVLRSSRLLKIAGSESRLLEVTFVNMSSQEVPLESIRIMGSTQRAFQCMIPGPIPPLQEVNLNLPTEVELPSFEGESGTTNLLNVNVPVKLKYLRSGCSNRPFFEVTIPIQVDLPARGTTRLSLKLNGFTVSYIREGRPFLDWEHLSVAVDDAAVQPDRISVSR